MRSRCGRRRPRPRERAPGTRDNDGGQAERGPSLGSSSPRAGTLRGGRADVAGPEEAGGAAESPVVEGARTAGHVGGVSSSREKMALGASPSLPTPPLHLP